ncbi:hypothetical protein F5B21DRAFT_507653 [Xylaria acuta]|nr:hypothetical protein F5B21DRAFT_507653 [Xylaria acuta]
MRASGLLVSLSPVVAAVVLADASNNTSPSLSQQKPEAESVFVDGSKHSTAAVARHSDEVTLLLTNKSDTAIVVAASTAHDDPRRDSTRYKRSNSKPKPKKKKQPKNKSNSTNSTEEKDDDDESGVGRGITLPISLAISLVLLVGALQI